MKVTVSKGITQDHWQHLTGWSERVFPVEGKGLEWSPVRWHLLAFDASDRPVAHIGFDKFSITSDRTIPLVGIGGVVVRPEYQRKRIPALLFDYLHTDVQKRFGLNAFALFCPERLVSYYGKQGYTRCDKEVWFKQKDQLVLSEFEFMYRGFELKKSAVTIPSTPW